MTPGQLLVSCIFALIVYGIAFYRGADEGSRIGLAEAAKARAELEETQRQLRFTDEAFSQMEDRANDLSTQLERLRNQ